MAESEKTLLFELRKIGKSYGNIEVLRDVDLQINAGEVVALLGENGAGKSTLSNIMSGATEPSLGDMLWRGERYNPTSPKEAMSAGIGMIHQELMLLPHLSIAENIFLGRYPERAGVVDHRTMVNAAEQSLKRLGLNISPDCLVDGLSTANQQLIEIAKALTLDAQVLILDEPTAALGGEETKLLFKQIQRLRDQGVGIVYISHRLEEIKQIADRIVVMRDGQKVQEFDSADVPVRQIVEAMVGRKMEQMFPPLPTPTDDEIFEVQGLCGKNMSFADISFGVRKGEIFGIAGLVGAGRTELVRAIAGIDPITEGAIRLHGSYVTPKSPADAIKNGIVLVPEDRKLQGVILMHSLADNIMYANMESVSSLGWINQSNIDNFASSNIHKFGVKGDSQHNANQLSGGNQQKVVIAKWLARKPKVVLLDEPTRGIDVGARSAIYEIIHALAENGVAVIVVSSDLEEILGVSNRILVMASGRTTGVLESRDANTVSVMELATA